MNKTIRQSILILLGALCIVGPVSAREILSDYFARGLQNAPGLKHCAIRRKYLQSLGKEFQAAEYPLEAEASALAGNFSEDIPFGLNPEQYPASSHRAIRGAELELLQRIDSAGNKKLVRQKLELERKALGLECQLKETQLKAELRKLLFGQILLRDLLEDINGIIASVKQIRRVLSAGYRDPVQGRYVFHTMQANIAHHENEAQALKLQMEKEQARLQVLTGVSPDLQNVAQLPVELPAIEMSVNEMIAASTGLQVLDLKTESVRLEVRIQTAASVEPLAVFAGGGVKEIGTAGGTRAFERESFVRVGLRLPLTDGSRLNRARAAEEALLEQAELKRQSERLQLTSRIRESLREYNSLRAQAAGYHRLKDTAHTQKDLLARALLSGRISYPDFWNGHELWHETEVQYARLSIQALAALMRLESLTGKDFSQPGKGQ